MASSIWLREREKNIYDGIEEKTDNYFNNLYEKTNGSDMVDVVIKNEFTYREGQHNYALDIMYAIRNKKIILIQAGVGCGKSYGYLIPIFNTFDGVKNVNMVKFEKVIISTSNIALQYQLIRDIDIISKELNIPMEAVIAKGVNNYACIKRIERLISSGYTFDSKREELKIILNEIRTVGSSDKADLTEINKNLWKDI